MNRFNEEDARRFYRWLGHRPGEYTEIRIIGWPPPAPVIRRWVQNEDDFIAICREWSGRRQVYAGVNPRKREGGSEEDVARVAAIPFDVDSDHPKNQPATDEELATARTRMIELVSWMRMQGYAAPFVAMSGNGYHVIQKVDIPVTDDLPGKLEAYFREAPTEGMDSIFDLPRIIKVPGTMSVKGKPSEDRPHRLSYIVSEGTPQPDARLMEHIRNLKPYTPTPEPRGAPATPKTDGKVKTTGLRPCFKQFAEEGGKLSNIGSEDNLLRLALVTEAHAKGYSRNEIIDLFRKAEDFNLKITTDRVNRQLADIAEKGMKPWSCLAIYKHHGCLGESCRRYKKHVARYLPKKEGEPPDAENPLRFFETDEAGNPTRFVPKLLGDAIMEKHRFAATDEKSEIWTYNPDKGIWERNGTELIQEVATKMLGHLFKAMHVAEVVKYIRYNSYIDHDLLGSNTSKIVVKNGVLNLDTGELEPFDPELYEINQIPVVYNPDAKCPRITKFLSEVLNPEDLDKFIEMIGYCLLKDYPIARIFVLTGTGRNGKSQALTLIGNFLGRENISSLTLQEIADDRFAKAQLFGKLANLAADIPSKPIKQTGTIKTLTGGDRLSAQHKFKSRFEFVNYAKLFFSANEVPTTYDNTDAFFRRMVILEFPNTFPAGDPKTVENIAQKISTPEELSGLLNLAIEGLRRLMKQGRFTGERTVEERAEEWIRASNPVQYFATQFIEMSQNMLSYITKSDLYKRYVQLCHAMGRRPIASNKFSMEIKRYLPYIDEGMKEVEVKDKKGKKKTTKIRVWYGIQVKLKELSEAMASLMDGTVTTIDTVSHTLIPTFLNRAREEESRRKEEENKVVRENGIGDRIDRSNRSEETPPPKPKLTEEEETILKILKRETQRGNDIGYFVLKGPAEYRLDKRYRPGEFETLLRRMKTRGLIDFDGRTVKLRRGREEAGP
ncbi:MAG: hypothetical protein JRD89_01315 [Deltaproteobacteria bacterium]|nr:hypothetical protein [Deltaproteobacteria bacterium]